MSKPVVAIVGRPNVGKSTLFNVLAGEMISIVKDTPGVTRDRIYADVDWLDRDFTLIDTGGIEPDSSDIILSQMREQAQIAIDTADVIIFITDVKQGLVDSDSKVADMLRRSGKPVVLVVNKVDNFDKYMADVYEFYNLGIGDPVPISAASRLGLGDMLDAVIAHFPEWDPSEEDDDRPRIAIVGKPNVGKSSLINAILGEERVIVSDIEGTTRDAIDTHFVSESGQKFLMIDTAGMRKRGKVYENTEKYSVMRAMRAIDRSDIVLMVLNAEEGIREQDKRVAGYAHEAGRGIIIVVNKWDGLDQDVKDRVKSELDRRLDFIDFARVHFISALHGSGVGNLFDSIKEAYACATQKMTTSLLTRILQMATDEHQPPMIGGRRIKLKYAHPGGYNPPIIVVHGNQMDKLPDSYKRYLSNYYRKSLKIIGSPIRLLFQEGSNPFAGRKNKLTPNQLRKRKRLMKFIKKAKR